MREDEGVSGEPPDDAPDDLDAYIAERSARDPEFAAALQREDQKQWLRETLRRAREEKGAPPDDAGD